jgi:hypothetical protein
MFQRHPPDPLVGLNRHPSSSNFSTLYFSSFFFSLLHYFVALLLHRDRAQTQAAVSAKTQAQTKSQRHHQRIFKSV